MIGIERKEWRIRNYVRIRKESWKEVGKMDRRSEWQKRKDK